MDTEQRLAIARARAVDVLDDAAEAERWLRRPSVMLGVVCPLELLTTDDGLRKVLAELTAIEHGLPP